MAGASRIVHAAARAAADRHPLADHQHVMASRGAGIVVDRGATLAVSPTLDITNDVLAQLNQQLPSVSVTPLPQAQQQQQPQGR
jgi:hypothetical protein